MSEIRIRIIGQKGVSDITTVEIKEYQDFPLSHDEFADKTGSFYRVEKRKCDGRGMFFDVVDITPIIWPC